MKSPKTQIDQCMKKKTKKKKQCLQCVMSAVCKTIMKYKTILKPGTRQPSVNPTLKLTLG